MSGERTSKCRLCLLDSGADTVMRPLVLSRFVHDLIRPSLGFAERHQERAEAWFWFSRFGLCHWLLRGFKPAAAGTASRQNRGQGTSAECR